MPSYPSHPSSLRLQQPFEPFEVEATRSHYVVSPPPKKQRMSLSQTYYIAQSARSKLGREACRPDHDLRLLVGHANLLDSLMLELADAEREQEAWFNQTVRNASQSRSSERHIQWADTIAEELDEDSDTDSDSDSDFDDEESGFEMISPLARQPSPAPQFTVTTQEIFDEEYEEYEEYYDDENDSEHALTRTPSIQQPPELVDDSDSDSDDATPLSPPQPNLEFSEKDREAIATSFIQDGFYIPQRNAPLIATI